ncbi:hypothetical protein Ga0466249_002095 [Sporomusaceae bacterium BoRhaA]|uniref:endonuclease Q family protein n=1 Tax=Pelorhabdus rhamnosifermentans TaxID=2772457 RepID=UPI001C06429F|nr:endonuclease Q family protein [Pelorhabdus rhamnosifermentans]MBU2700984.1 hypothetical protein [Pelorhabdus rhamnosifermentans]
MKSYYADLHIHVGMSECGRWVKIPTSARLTVRNILEESLYKGLHLIGIIDALSPLVQNDIEQLIEEGLLIPVSGGGYRYATEQGTLNLLLGAEIETTEPQGGSCHTLVYFPDLSAIKPFTLQMSKHIKNVNMSSQNAHMSFAELVDLAVAYDTLIVPAHVFTPFKSLFGAVSECISHILSDKQLNYVAAMEIGLSADSLLADRLAELQTVTLLSNSDAHSLDKIGREFNVFSMEEPTFSEFSKVLKRSGQRKVMANYGLNPQLGKYHETVCLDCGSHGQFFKQSLRQFTCKTCGSSRVVRGVFDRIFDIADFALPQHPAFRPSYIYQIPLAFLPGIGPKTRLCLRNCLASEIYILHEASFEELEAATNAKIADKIIKGRAGNVLLNAGGGGLYGKVFLE